MYIVSNDKVRGRREKLSKYITDNGLSASKYFINMNIVDYYFYRVYMIFLRRKEYARVTTCIFFCKLFLITFFFISIFMTHYMTGDFFPSNISSHIIYLIVFITPVLFGIIIYNIYSKKRIKEILERYSNSKYNKLLSDKLIQYVPYIELTIGFTLCFFISNK